MLTARTERRRFLRMSVDCPMTYTEDADSTRLTGIAVNLSSDGILFLADQPSTLGARLRIRVPPGKAVTPPFEALIEVVRIEAVSTENTDSAAVYRIAGAVTELIR